MLHLMIGELRRLVKSVRVRTPAGDMSEVANGYAEEHT